MRDDWWIRDLKTSAIACIPNLCFQRVALARRERLDDTQCGGIIVM